MKKIMFAKTHEWVEIDGNKGRIGITDFAQRELGDLVYISLPEIGARLECGKPLCDVESVKAVSDINSPVCGTVTAVNEELESAPETINSEPMSAWICEVGIDGTSDLLTEEEYNEFIKG